MSRIYKLDTPKAKIQAKHQKASSTSLWCKNPPAERATSCGRWLIILITVRRLGRVLCLHAASLSGTANHNGQALMRELPLSVQYRRASAAAAAAAAAHFTGTLVEEYMAHI